MSCVGSLVELRLDVDYSIHRGVILHGHEPNLRTLRSIAGHFAAGHKQKMMNDRIR
jgi:hypothetical protein